MKNPLLIVLIILLVCSNAIAQKSKPGTIPSATPAGERWAGYLQRQQLIESSLVKNVPFRNVGPTIMSGRVVDLEVDPNDPAHFYVAYASGGLWETTNEGASFVPLFDQEIVMTIGDIAVDWERKVLYVGSGENNSSRSSYSGYGLFKSSDNGDTWQHLGLPESHHISRVVLHPTSAQTLWVAVLGHLYSANEERGVYKTTDGGQTWEKTLFVDRQTGIADLIINPENPRELLAAAWQKDRKAWDFTESGKGSAIFKSNDGGVTWLNVSSGNSGFPDTEGTGRIGLTYAPSSPNVIYAVLDNQERREKEEKEEKYAVSKEVLRKISREEFLNLKDTDLNDYLDREGFPETYNAVDIKADVQNGTVKPIDLVAYLEDANSLLFDTPVKGAEVYRSDDGGETWQKTHEGYIESLVFSYGYYFGQIRVDGLDPNIIYTMGVPLIKSLDGGKTWQMTNMDNAHADHHALWVNPDRSGHLINGNDGGVNISYDYGETWVKCNSTPVGQFYTVNVDMAEPYNVYGGLQDNGVWKGPSTYEYSRSWHEEGRYPYERLMGGDGMQVAIDTRTNDLVYTGYQFGNYFRINTTTGDRKYITPKHKLGEVPLRWNWQAPLILSSHNQDIVYFGSNKFHRSMNGGEDFETLSEDLTNGGKKGDVAYGTLTTISESPIRFGLIYTGSDDGLIHVSKDAGQTWERISNALPQHHWVSRVVASGHKEGRVYATLNGYRWDHFGALAFASEDYGKTWFPIGDNLPGEPINVIKEDPENENVLYVGTDHGAYVSIDRGSSFMAFQGGLPAVAVHDLVVHPREKDLILGTHGRSIYIADISALQQLPSLRDSLRIFPIEQRTFSESWGNKADWHWIGYSEPETQLEIYSPVAGEAEISITLDNLLLKKWSATLDRGLSYVTYDYTLDSTNTEDLAAELKLEQPIAPRENGKFYLPAGNYTVSISLQGAISQGSIEVKVPQPPPKRKGSE